MKTKLFISLLLLTLGGSLFAQTTCTWNGSENSDWNHAANWFNSIVPVTGDDVIIQTGVFAPSLNDNCSVRNVTIETGASLSLEAFNFTVTGNWNNAGIFNADSGCVFFSGITHQTISGNQTFHHITVQNEAGVEIVSGEVSLAGNLNISDGQFITNNSLVILSGPNGTGAIGPLTSGNISGEITMQRYLSAATAGWRFLSSPIEGSSLNQVADDFWTSGFPGSTYPSSSFISVYYYNESDSGTADIGYAPAGSINDLLPAGKGFMAYIDSTSLLGMIEFTGIPNSGNIAAPVTYTLSDTISDGWNLVGNPYPSSIDWDDSSIQKVNIYDAVYVWDQELEVYTSYVDGIGTNGGSSIIAAGQSFYVIASDTTPVLEFSENCKAYAPANFFKSTGTISHFTMSVENSAGMDETVFKPNADATNSFDGGFDAIKMFSSNLNLPSVYSTDSDENYYSINQFSISEMEIPIYVNTGISEMHTISFSGNSVFSVFSCVFLYDTHTGINYDLKTTTEISLFISDTTYAPRFILKVGAPFFIESVDATCYGENNGSINIAKNSNSEFSVNWFDQFGGLVQSDPYVYQVIEIQDLSEGLYVVESSDLFCGTRIDSVFILQPEEIVAHFESSADTILIPEQSAEIAFTNESLNATYFSWEFGDLGTSALQNPVFEFTTAGTHNVTLTAHQNATCYKEFTKIISIISTMSLSESGQPEPGIQVISDQLYITAPDMDYIEVRNLNGQLIASAGPSQDQVVIDLSGAAVQYMLVTVVSGNFTFTKKVYFN